MKTLLNMFGVLIACALIIAASYDIGYLRGSSAARWQDFYQQSKRDSISKVENKKQRVEWCMQMYRSGFVWGVLEYQTYGSTAWQLFKKDSIAARRMVE